MTAGEGSDGQSGVSLATTCPSSRFADGIADEIVWRFTVTVLWRYLQGRQHRIRGQSLRYSEPIRSSSPDSRELTKPDWWRRGRRGSELRWRRRRRRIPWREWWQIQ